MIEEINKIFTELVLGKLTSEEWELWFEQNQKNVEIVCGKRYYLKIKTKKSNSDIANVFYGQTAVIKWLKSKNIIIPKSEVYEKAYNKELDEYSKKQKEELKKKRIKAEAVFGYIKEEYPKFYRQLIKSFDESTVIEKGIDTKKIETIEAELSSTFTSELRTFFMNISIFVFEGIEINFENLEKQLINEKEFLILGEFWEYGDGDKLLYDQLNGTVLVFAHEYNPPKIIKQSNNIKDFIENKLVSYLKEFET